LWSATIGAVAGGATGLVILIALLMIRIPLEYALWTPAVTAVIGAIIAFAFGNKKIG
jgi:hypothetical protein